MRDPIDVASRGEPSAARDGRLPPGGPGALVQLAPRDKKAFVRAPKDRTQAWRRGFQLAFLALNVAIGVQFWAFVRFFESGGASPAVPRPPGVEGWLPIAALMNLKRALLTGELPSRFPAGMVLLVAFLAITFLFRKTFCSWLPTARSTGSSPGSRRCGSAATPTPASTAGSARRRAPRGCRWT
jgi:hypothetical protein